MRNLYNLKGEGNNPRRSSAPQHETKKSRKNLLPLFALLLLMAVAPAKAWAQSQALPYTQNFENLSGTLPLGWSTPDGSFAVIVNSTTGNHYLRGLNGYIMLPYFSDAQLNELILEMNIQNNSPDHIEEAHLEIGYVINNNFTALKTIDFVSAVSLFRMDFAGAPSGARLAIRSINHVPDESWQTNWNWLIDDLRVYQAEKIDVSQGNYTEGFENATIGSLPDSWLYSSYDNLFPIGVSAEGAQSGNRSLKSSLVTGVTILPETEQSLSDLVFEMSIKNTSTYYSEFKAYIKLGYVDEDENFTEVTSIKIPKATYTRVRVDYQGAPAGSRIAFKTDSETNDYLWYIDDVQVFQSPTKIIPFTEGFSNNWSQLPLPSGWSFIPTPGFYQSYCHIKGVGQNMNWTMGVQHGYLLLPRFSQSIDLKTLSFKLKFENESGIADGTVDVGYVTNPLNPSGSFVSLKSFMAFGMNDPTEFELLRVDYSGIPAYARMAIKCTTSIKSNVYQQGLGGNEITYYNWYLDDFSVTTTSNITLPSTPPYSYTNGFELEETNSLPDNYLGENAYVGQNQQVARTGSNYLSMANSVLVFPKIVNERPNSKMQLTLYAKPVVAMDGLSSISVGYVTSPNNGYGTFTSLKTFDYTSEWVGVYWRITYELDTELPTGARFAIMTQSGHKEWAIDDLKLVAEAPLALPYFTNFEYYDDGELPAGWLGGIGTTITTDYNPYSGQNSFGVGNLAYAVLPSFNTESFDNVTMEMYVCPYQAINGSQVLVGYITNPNDISTFTRLVSFNGSTNWTDYQKKSIDLTGVPANARLVIKAATGAWWNFDNIRIYGGEAIPYEQPFATTELPEGWGNYHGELNWNSTTNTGTANLTTDNEWHFDEQNGVFDSHAYTILGGNSLQFKWLVSPSIYIPSNASNANDIYLCATLALTRYTGNQVPVTAGQQDHEGLGIYITEDNGATWKKIRTFGNGTGYDMPFDNGYLPVNGLRRAFSLDEYRNKTVRIGFYAFNTNAYDAWNHVHIDDFYVGELDNTTAPSNVTVSEIGGRTAKVSWTPGNPLQLEWDIWIPQSGESDPNTEFWTIENLQQYGQLIHTTTFAYNYVLNNLTPNSNYRVWVRYRSGSDASSWVNSDSFQTVPMCAPPTNITVSNITSHSALVSWTPGQANQTSWDTFGGEDDQDGETVTVPYRLLTGLYPDTDYDFTITGYCEDGDGVAEGVSSETFHTLPLPTLEVNETTTSWDEYVVISGHETVNSCSRTQFIIPSNMLTPMQYSTIIDMKFYPKDYQGAQPWGQFAAFNVYVKEVEESNLGSYCGNSFYPWESMTTIYTGSLYIQNGVMTIHFPESTPFSYHEGNLLIGIAQINNGYGEECQISWYAAGNNPNSALYEPNGLDPECIHSLPKVTFTYETDPYLPPTDLDAQFVSPNEVFYSWTPRAGQTATIIQIAEDADFTTVFAETNDTGSQCVASFGSAYTLAPETNYYVRAKGVYGEGEDAPTSAWGPTLVFITPDACEPPASLTAEAGPFSATLNWVSGAEYDEVEYREVLGETSQVTLQSNFNNANQLTTQGWTLWSNEEAGWTHITIGSGARTIYAMQSTITASNDFAVHKHRLITPQIQLPGNITFNAWGTSGEALKIYVSTSGTNSSDFQQVGTSYTITATNPRIPQTITVDLSSFEGVGYIAIEHSRATDINISTNPPTYSVGIDDFVYNQITTNYSDWTPAGITSENTMTLTGLTPGHTYEARVKAHCNTGFASDWSTVSFTTVNNIVFEDEENVKPICVENWDTNGDGELSYAEAAEVTTLNPSGGANNSVFKGNADISKFNELQYFTNPELTTIPDHAFAGCVNLQEITLPPQITSIGNYAFGYATDNQGQIIPCSSLHSIVIPEGVTQIGDYAFSRSGLESIILPFSLTHIGQQAFEHCPLTNVYVPASVNYINNNPFLSASIETIEVDPMNDTFDSRNACNAIIRKSDNKLISGCKNTDIPYGVVSIGYGAFEYVTGLTSITLPSSVATIGESAFSNCTGLTSIIVESYTPPTIENNAFQNVNTANITVYVPCGRVAAYQAAEGWSSFANIVGDGCETSYSLVAGVWKWWAPFEGATAADLMEAFDNGIVQGDILVNSQDEGFLRRSGGTWGGTLTSIEPGKMYKVLTEASGMLTVTGEHPSTVTVELGQGYTWFGFIGNAPVEIRVALGTTPTDDDKIFTDDGRTYTYSEDNGLWQSNDGYYIENFNLQPGYGYIYYSASGSKTLIMQQ